MTPAPTCLLFNAVQPVERLNVADTQKIPWQAYLGVDQPLLSGDGRVLATITADTSGHHDAFCGTTTDRWNRTSTVTPLRRVRRRPGGACS